jgi:hypothetical protein
MTGLIVGALELTLAANGSPVLVPVSRAWRHGPGRPTACPLRPATPSRHYLNRFGIPSRKQASPCGTAKVGSGNHVAQTGRHRHVANEAARSPTTLLQSLRTTWDNKHVL